MKVLLKLPLNPHTGYGNDGIGIALALRQAGCDVYLSPTTVQTPLPPDVAELLTKRLVEPFDLLIHHVDPGQLGISPVARRCNHITVAWTMWEFSTLDNLNTRSKTKKRLKDYDLVVGYDQVSSGALAKYVTTNAATVQGGYWPDLWPQAPRNWDAETFNFCMVGALHERKNPFVAIEAFKELREEHPELNIALNLKTVDPGLHKAMEQWCPGLRIYYDTWDSATMRAFYASQHVLLAPSRGEGKNMPALEMMSTGGSVIATNWGGHTQWLGPATGYPLDYKLVPLTPAKPDCQWAQADKQHLKQLMLYAATHRDEVRRKGETAAELIPAMCSWPAAIDRLMDKVGQVRGDVGGHVLAGYRRDKERAQETRQAVPFV